jgi:hypothetical protein
VTRPGKAETDAPSEYLSGVVEHARKVLASYGTTTTTADEEARRVRKQERDLLALPGGAVGLVGEKRQIESAILEGTSAIERLLSVGHKDTSPQIVERRGSLDAQKRSLARIESILDSLPKEATTDPFVAIRGAEDQIAAARARGDSPAITAAARQLEALRRAQAAAHADSGAAVGKIQAGAARVRQALASDLTKAFATVTARVKQATSDPALAYAPELLDRKTIEKLWREAGRIIEAIHLLGFAAPSHADLLAAVPEPAQPAVRALLGMAPKRWRDAGPRDGMDAGGVLAETM